MKVREYNHRIEVEDISSSELDLLKKTLKVDFYRFSSGRRVFDKTENLLYREEGVYFFPPGMLEYVGTKFDKINEDIYVDDYRSVPRAFLHFKDTDRKELWPNQAGAKEAFQEEENNVGFITSVMGSGKTRIIEEIVKDKGVTTLIVAPTEAIRDGIVSSLSEIVSKNMITTSIPKEDDFFAPKEILQNYDDFKPERMEDEYLLDKGFKKYGGNWHKVEKATNELCDRKKKRKEERAKKKRANIFVCCFQSLNSASVEWLRSIELFIGDEGHTAKNKTIRSALLCMPNAYFRYFISATMWADLKEDMLLLMSACGQNHIFEELPYQTIEDKRIAEPEFYQRRSPLPNHPVGRWKKDRFGNSKIVHTKDFDTMVKLGIVGNSTRNDDVCDVALREFEEGNRVLICNTEEIHGHILQELLSKKWLEKIKMDISCSNKTQILEKLNTQNLIDQIDQSENLENIRNRALELLDENFQPEYIFGRESRESKKNMIKEASYGEDPCIYIGTNAVGIGVDTKNINVVLLVDVRKSSIRVLQSIGRGDRIKSYQNNDLENDAFKVYAWDDWFHPKLQEHSRKVVAIYEKYFLGRESVTKEKWGRF